MPLSIGTGIWGLGSKGATGKEVTPGGEVLFLGIGIGDGQIRMDKQKVKAIEEWGVPVTELRSVLGLLN
ncbi:putative mitochondrial protein [Sesbania bispinosa]|nr:putative mitochondrial protein [Sesbania bispinosa]